MSPRTTHARRAGLLLHAALAALAATSVAGCARRPAEPTHPSVIDVTKKSGAPAGVTARACEDGLGPALDPEHAEGARIVDVCLTGAAPETTAAVRKALRLGPDKTLTAEALRRDLESVYATGFLEQIEARARQSGTGAVLVLVLEERARVSGITFEGLRALSKDPALEAFPVAGAPLGLGALLGATQKLRDAYVERGWEDATVAHTVTLEGKDRARVKIVVNEGAPARVGKVTFEGAQGGREVGLRKAIQLEEGTVLSPERLERAGLLVTSYYYDNGFVNVRVDTPKRTRAADGSTAISFAITEGPVFRIGKIRVKKVDAAAEKEVLSAMSSKPGEIFRRSKLAADIEAITTRAREKGKPVNVEPETSLDTKAGTIDVTLALTDAR